MNRLDHLKLKSTY